MENVIWSTYIFSVLSFIFFCKNSDGDGGGGGGAALLDSPFSKSVPDICFHSTF